MQYRVPREILQEIQTRTSLVEVIGRYVSLQKRGRSYVGLCPFHGEKSPSFHVDESKGMFYCFGCQVGGDVFKFLTLIENESFMEVVRELASKCGIHLPEKEITPEEKKSLDERDILFNLLESAAAWFERNLMGASAARPLSYLQKRGLSDELIREYRLGYAPDSWQGLTNHLTSSLLRQRLPVELAQKAGLVIPRDQGDGHYDRFRDRVMFPIRNVSGKVIAFGGRILDKGEPKYLNSPESPLFNKSQALYGIDAARRAIGHEDCVVVVEGYFDTLALHAAGIKNVVATCGTSLTKGHLTLLKRYTRRVVIMYDGDKAGQNAAERSLGLFLDEDLWPAMVVLPEGQDPDDVVKNEGADAFRQRIKRAVPLFDHLIMRYGRMSQISAQARDEALEQLSPLFARLRPEKIDFYASFMAQHFGMHDHVAREYLDRTQQSRHNRLADPRTDAGRSLQAPVKKPSVFLPPQEEFLVHWIIQRPEEILPAAIEAGIADWLVHDGLRQVVLAAIERYTAQQPIDAIALVASVPDPGLQNKLSELCVRELVIEDQDREKALVQSLLGIKDKYIQYELRRLQGEIARLEREGGQPGEMAQLAMRKMELNRMQAQLRQRSSGRAA